MAENLVCPNCGSELLRRPVRPATGSYSLTIHPASTERVYHPEGCVSA